MAPLFDESKSGSDIPSEVEFSLDTFRKYKDLWLLWRALGHETDSGSWVPPLSFMEAQDIPKEMIDLFLDLDHFFNQMKKYREKKRKGSGPSPRK